MTRTSPSVRRRAVATAAATLAAALAAAPAVASSPPDPAVGQDQLLESLYGDQRWQGRLLWLDLSANRTALDSREEVRDVMQRTAGVGFETVVVDVKNYTGFVAYRSELAPHLSTTEITPYKPYPANYDLLQTVVEEGHEVGLDVIAAVNVFSEGSTVYKDGPAYEHPDWQTTFLDATRVVQAADGASAPLTGVDITRGTNALVAYTPEKYDVSPANQWGVEAQVVGGEVVRLVDRTSGQPALAVPDNGYVLSGHGEAATWMRAHLAEGQSAAIEARTELVRAADYSTAATFVNPILPAVQDYELSIVREIAEKYDVDGISLDRARYSDVHADFSTESRQAFEAHLGRTIENWPADVMSIEIDGFTEQRVEGPLFQKWIEWRARNVQQFFQRARDEIHAVDPSLFFTDYVGAWYPLYYEEGVNWGSRDVQPDYNWASESYGTTGYAEDMDFLMVGTYFDDVTEQDAVDSGKPAPWYSVEGSAELATGAIDEATFVYASLYLLQYREDPERFRAAMEMAMKRTHGIMLFDLVYLEQYGWWDIVEDVFDQFPNVQEPHTNPAWQRMLRADG
jgi:uncharacterized lipoprotein YddW (UPF0748 family)